MTIGTTAKKSRYGVSVSGDRNVQNQSGRRNDKERLEEEGNDDNSNDVPSEVVAYSKWWGRLTWTSIIQGAMVALLTAMLATFVATTGYPSQLVKAVLSIPQIGFSEITALAG